MLRDFEHFDYAVGELGMLQELKGLRVAVDASHYLETRVLSSNYEPLVCALGGLPFGFRSRVELDLAYFSKYEIEPVFIFSGIDISRPGDPFRQRQQGVEVNQEAWGLYNRHQANDSVHKFKESRKVS